MISTSDLSDAHGEAVAVCDLQFRSFGQKGGFAGPVTTLRCFEDHLHLRAALSEQGAGRVLVVDGGGSLRCALMGDRLGEMAVKNGWAGIVVNGAIRDAEALAGMAIGVKALGTIPRRSAVESAGYRDIPLRFGGVNFAPRTWLYADLDGVLVSPVAL